MAATRWTDAKIKALRPGEQKRYELIDRGLRLAIYPTGAKAWFLRYKVAGRDEMVKVADYGEGEGCLGLAGATTKAADLRRQAEAAREGTAAAPKQRATVARAERLAEPTVRELASLWLLAPGKKGPKSPGTVIEYRRMLERDVLPHIGDLRAAHATDKHLRAVLDKIGERGKPVAVSETFKMLRAMFRYAVDSGRLQSSPMAAMKYAPGEREKNRTLSDAELRSFFARLAADETRVGKATELCLLWVLVTACRPGEARGALWSEVDEAAGTWTIPGTRTKNRRAHVVTLSEAARGLLVEARGNAGKGQYVFPGLLEGAPLSEQALSHCVRRLRERLALDGVTEEFTPHDLRRSAATIIAGRLGFGRFMASQILGHISETEAGVTAIYDRHDYAPERALAWHALGDYIAALRAGKAPKVRSLAEARKKKAVAA